MSYFVYILSNHNGRELEIGVSVNPKRIVDEKRAFILENPTAKTPPAYLVFYYPFDSEDEARALESEILGQSWIHQTRYINQNNPEWHDLYHNILV